MEGLGAKKLKGASPNSWTLGSLTNNKQKQYNLKITLVCLLLTVLILRGSIGISFSASFSSDHYDPSDSSEYESTGALARDVSSEQEPYRLGPKISDWDEQRAAWLSDNPHMRSNSRGKPRILLLTGSQAKSCKATAGDHYLLKAIKNKIDYCRLYDIDIYYNMIVQKQEMNGFWIKLPLIRSMMLAHPEAEWIWWMDSDAMFTDMSFEIPLDRYENHNMVIHGWDHKVYGEKHWCGLNAGVFLLRNSQWTLDFLDLWAPMGENRGSIRQQVGKMFTAALTGRPPNFDADDQSGLVYLLNAMRDEVAPKVYLENAYFLHGYWVILSDKYEQYMRDNEPGTGDERWPFVTHFVGCKSCGGSGDYPAKQCLKEMERAFNFADNQVLQAFGFQHKSLTDSSVIPTSNHQSKSSRSSSGDKTSNVDG